MNRSNLLIVVALAFVVASGLWFTGHIRYGHMSEYEKYCLKGAADCSRMAVAARERRDYIEIRVYDDAMLRWERDREAAAEQRKAFGSRWQLGAWLFAGLGCAAAIVWFVTLPIPETSPAVSSTRRRSRMFRCGR
jgi:hypothetical protein